MNSKAETIINESNIVNALELIYITVISNIQKSLGKGSAWITDNSAVKLLLFQSTIP